jgi:hypothetical protein
MNTRGVDSNTEISFSHFDKYSLTGLASDLSNPN